jgi:hypothetical protein
MNINLIDYDFFTFSWLDTSLENIEKHISTDNVFGDNRFRIKKVSQIIGGIRFEYNPKICIAYFIKTDNGIIMIPNLQDGWNSLFYTITFDLKTNGYFFTLSSKDIIEPYNCMIYIESGIEKRICSNIKENKKWTFYEKGEPLFFEDIGNYKNKLKRKRLNQNIIIKYLQELKITTNGLLEIENNGNNILLAEYNNRVV